MKVSVLVEDDKISAKYRNAGKLVTIVNNQKLEESITAQNGKDLAKRVNQIMPDAFIISWAGPSIRFINKQIEIYEANAGDDLDDVLDLYKQGKLKKYVNPHPFHTCGCATCKSCNP